MTDDIEQKIETLKRAVERRASASPRGAHGLNAKQELFAQGILRGLSGVAAARGAGYTGTEASLASAASKLLKVAKVRWRIEEAQNAAALDANVTLDTHLDMLAQIRDKAMKTGQYAAAARCEELRGKVSGLYDRERTAEASTITAQVAKLTAEEQVALAHRALARIRELAPELAAEWSNDATKH